MSGNNDEDEKPECCPTHSAPIDEEVSEAESDFDAAHALAPDGIAATASAVEPIWQRVYYSLLHSSTQLPVFRILTLR
jgi:hypothetical protein